MAPPTAKERNQKRIAPGLVPYFPKNKKRESPKNREGISINTAIGKELFLLARKPTCNNIANNGNTKRGIFVMIWSILF